MLCVACVAKRCEGRSETCSAGRIQFERFIVSIEISAICCCYQYEHSRHETFQGNAEFPRKFSLQEASSILSWIRGGRLGRGDRAFVWQMGPRVKRTHDYHTWFQRVHAFVKVYTAVSGSIGGYRINANIIYDAPAYGVENTANPMRCAEFIDRIQQQTISDFFKWIRLCNSFMVSH